MLSIFTLILYCTAEVAALNLEKNDRAFGLFTILSFPNSECSASEDGVIGTCYKEDECTTKGGTASGNCGVGFGVCCVFSLNTCPGTVTRNITYITSPNFPTSFTTAGDCMYTINKMNDEICQIRLDFKDLVLTEVNTGKCGTMDTDKLTITAPGIQSPTGFNGICGDNLSGSHMYIDTPVMGSVKMNINIGSASGTRNWKVRVTQFSCASANRAPPGCLQYFTGPSGIISSFNAAGEQLVSGLSYTVCIRPEAGMCKVQYAASKINLPGGTAAGMSQNANGCDMAGIMVPNMSPVTTFCGDRFSSGLDATENGAVVSDVMPFAIRVMSLDAAYTPGDAEGFILNYRQMAC